MQFKRRPTEPWGDAGDARPGFQPTQSRPDGSDRASKLQENNQTAAMEGVAVVFDPFTMRSLRRRHATRVRRQSTAATRYACARPEVAPGDSCLHVFRSVDFHFQNSPCLGYENENENERVKIEK